MTNNAVNYKLGMDSNAIKKAENVIKKLEAELKAKGLELDRDKLTEAIRTNKVNEYLREAELDEKKWKNEQDVWLNIAKIFMGGGVEGGKLLANDESWHNKLQDTYDQATNLSFSYKGGQPLVTGWSENKVNELVRPVLADFSNLNVKDELPNGGIAVVKYIPTFSIQAQNVESGETQNVVRTIWNKVRSANSGYINGYDQSDLFQFVFCSSAVAEVLAVIMRPFNFMDAKRKLANIYMASDKHVLNAMTNGRANEVIINKTSFIQVINSKLRSFNAQKLPIGFDLTKRRLVLNRNIFTHKNNKDEMYIFIPQLTYKYNEADGKCEAIDLPLNEIFQSPDKMADFLEKLISPLVNGNASSIMAGDIAKAYPKKVGTLNSLKYTLKGDLFSDDEHILESIRNANVVGCINANDYSQFDIKQGINANQDTFVYTGTLDPVENVMTFNFIDTDWKSASDDEGSNLATILGLDSDHPSRKYFNTNLLDVKVDIPTRYDIMAGTRFKVNRDIIIEGKEMDDEEAVVTSTIITGCGTEIINDIEFIYFANATHYASNNPDYKYYANVFQPQFCDVFSMYKIPYIGWYKNFRYAPYNPNCTLMIDLTDTYDYSVSGFVIGRGNYNMRLITAWELDQLNIASFGSLLLTDDDKISDRDLA